MREFRTPGSVRGPGGDPRSYRDGVVYEGLDELPQELQQVISAAGHGRLLGLVGGGSPRCTPEWVLTIDKSL